MSLPHIGTAWLAGKLCHGRRTDQARPSGVNMVSRAGYPCMFWTARVQGSAFMVTADPAVRRRAGHRGAGHPEAGDPGGGRAAADAPRAVQADRHRPAPRRPPVRRPRHRQDDAGQGGRPPHDRRLHPRRRLGVRPEVPWRGTLPLCFQRKRVRTVAQSMPHQVCWR